MRPAVYSAKLNNSCTSVEASIFIKSSKRSRISPGNFSTNNAASSEGNSCKTCAMSSGESVCNRSMPSSAPNSLKLAAANSRSCCASAANTAWRSSSLSPCRTCATSAGRPLCKTFIARAVAPRRIRRRTESSINVTFCDCIAFQYPVATAQGTVPRAVASRVFQDTVPRAVASRVLSTKK